MDEKIVMTVIALDVAFSSLLRNLRAHHPALAMDLQAELESGATNRSAGLPAVTERLFEFAAMLASAPSASDRQ